nr:tRNA-dihydrouridine synthase [Streptomyces lushanensis]
MPQPALVPGRLWHFTLRNRLAVAPMTRVSATDNGTPTAGMADHYQAFAEGGFGLIITEGTYTDSAYAQGYTNQPGIVTAAHTRGWSTVTARIHAAGAAVFLQLTHAGALSQGNPHRPGVTAGPSPVRPRGEMRPEYGGTGPWPLPREMSLVDIRDATRGFAEAALRARTAGFDGVEIHAADGHLIDQFLTPRTNRRTDAYNGHTLSGRLRLLTHVITHVRAAVGIDFLLGVRLSRTEVNDVEHSWDGPEEAREIFCAAAHAGASYLHIAVGSGDWPRTATLETGESLTALARRTTGLPVIANGGMHDPSRARDVLTGGHADLLSLGRGALANPDLPRLLADGQSVGPVDHGMISPAAGPDNTAHRRTRHDRT